MDQRNGIYLANHGLGPAIIKAVSVEVGGKSYSAADKHPWRRALQDLNIISNCFKYSLVQPESALKSGEELALLTVTNAESPVIDGRPCHVELIRLMKAEGLKVRIQYESMYSEPYETVDESPIDTDLMSDISTAVIQQVAPKLADQIQSLLPQFQQIADQLQQMQDKVMKHAPGLAELTLLRYLYQDPPGAPWDWWLHKRDYSIDPQDKDQQSGPAVDAVDPLRAGP